MTIKKSKKRLIAEQIHYNIFSLLRTSVGSDKAYAMASGYCPVFDTGLTEVYHETKPKKED